MDREPAGGGRPLRDAYDAAYTATWERIRGSLAPSDYARLTAAAERGTLPRALDATGVRATAWMCVRRAFAKRIERDRELAAAVAAARAAEAAEP
jgi:hypothetical protein